MGEGGHATANMTNAVVTAEALGQLTLIEQAIGDGTRGTPQQRREAANAKQNDETCGMVPTLLVPGIHGDRLSWVSIGDQPLFLCRARAADCND